MGGTQQPSYLERTLYWALPFTSIKSYKHNNTEKT